MSISLQAKNHWKCEQKLTSDDLRIQKFFDSLRPIARRQIKSLNRRMKCRRNKSLYLDRIRKLIAHEIKRKWSKKRGEEID